MKKMCNIKMCNMKVVQQEKGSTGGEKLKNEQSATWKNHNMKKYATWRELNIKKEQLVKRVAGKKHTT